MTVQSLFITTMFLWTSIKLFKPISNRFKHRDSNLIYESSEDIDDA